MNVKEMIDTLSNEVDEYDRENAEIGIWCGEQEYEIERMAGFSLSPDIVIHLKPTTSPIMKPAVFKKKMKPMVDKTIKKINKERRKEG
jgi:hypothetical protein